MWRNTAIVFLAAAILVPLSACQLATPEEAAEKQALPSAEEIVDGVAQALKDLRTTLRRGGFLTRDPRAKERKKYGRKKARKKFQYSKR